MRCSIYFLIIAAMLVSQLTSAQTGKITDSLSKEIINEPAPAFTLKDADGKTVSLSDLKGKIVVVDFWATWCGPCKASFPGMQTVVDKYKDNPNVVFLFVDALEVSENYMTEAKKYIADNKYTFHVLFDEKGADGRQSKMITAYNVAGIPTKFIIDKNGNIRFKKLGAPGPAENILEEINSMVEMAGK